MNNISLPVTLRNLTDSSLLPNVLINCQLYLLKRFFQTVPRIKEPYEMSPRGDAGGLSREYVLRIPSVS